MVVMVGGVGGSVNKPLGCWSTRSRVSRDVDEEIRGGEQFRLYGGAAITIIIIIKQ